MYCCFLFVFLSFKQPNLLSFIFNDLLVLFMSLKLKKMKNKRTNISRSDDLFGLKPIANVKFISIILIFLFNNKTEFEIVERNDLCSR